MVERYFATGAMLPESKSIMGGPLYVRAEEYSDLEEKYNTLVVFCANRIADDKRLLADIEGGIEHFALCVAGSVFKPTDISIQDKENNDG